MPFFTLDGDGSLMPFDDFPHNGQSKPAAFLLGGEERIENLLEVFLMNTASVIFDLYAIVLAFMTQEDFDFPSLPYGLDGIDEDIQECPVKEFLVREESKGPAVKVVSYGDLSLLKLRLQEGQILFNDLFQVALLQIRGLRPGEIQELRYDPVQAGGFFGDDR